MKHQFSEAFCDKNRILKPLGILFFFPVMPVVDFSSIPQKVVNVLAGKPLELDMPIIGRPPPVCSWYFAENKLKITERVKIKSTGKFSKLTVNDTTIDDTGDYTLELKNAVGTLAEIIKVIVLCKEPSLICYSLFMSQLSLLQINIKLIKNIKQTNCIFCSSTFPS